MIVHLFSLKIKSKTLLALYRLLVGGHCAEILVFVLKTVNLEPVYISANKVI